ncbi:MAG: glutathione S-transferase family protein [Oscillatoriales cyanobacterium SM2_2_1]|nr:glutathione S-transferase family protein [Oscillatoriales cyanobacterium SM2_2_1]
MIRFYFHHTPNPMKVALFLEESGIPYEVIPIDIFKGDQHTTEFKQFNPNSKVPAIVDGETVVFDSNAILLYLGEKTGKFLHPDRGLLLSWLMFVATGLSPFSGQAVHFQTATDPIPYAINRYRREVERHYQILDQQLTDRSFILGETYTIIDMAAWGWIDRYPRVLGENALTEFPQLARWYSSINDRPATLKAKSIGKDIPFKSTSDEETLRAMFPQNYPKA